MRINFSCAEFTPSTGVGGTAMCRIINTDNRDAWAHKLLGFCKIRFSTYFSVFYTKCTFHFFKQTRLKSWSLQNFYIFPSGAFRWKAGLGRASTAHTCSPPLQHHKSFQEKGQAHGAALGKIKATTVMSKSHESSVFRFYLCTSCFKQLSLTLPLSERRQDRTQSIYLSSIC